MRGRRAHPRTPKLRRPAAPSREQRACGGYAGAETAGCLSIAAAAAGGAGRAGRRSACILRWRCCPYSLGRPVAQTSLSKFVIFLGATKGVPIYICYFPVSSVRWQFLASRAGTAHHSPVTGQQQPSGTGWHWQTTRAIPT